MRRLEASVTSHVATVEQTRALAYPEAFANRQRISKPRDIEAGARSLFSPLSLLVVCVLVLSSGRIHPVLAGLETAGVDFPQLALLVFYAIAAGLLIQQPSRLALAVHRMPGVMLVLGVAAVSALWSDVPQTTLARSAALTGATLFGMLVGISFRIPEILRLLGAALLVAGVASAGAILAIPDIAVDSGWHAGAWQGIYAHKNVLARSMALAVIAWILIAGDVSRRQPFGWAVAAALGVVMAGSGSATAAAVVAIMLLALPALRVISRTQRVLLVAGAAVVLLVAPLLGAAGVHPERLLELLGRDETLTGRTLLWETVRDEIAKNPLIGVGYGAFWDGWDAPAGNVWRVVGWTPNDSHNGILDLWLDLGAAGFGAFLVTFVGSLRVALAYARRTPGAAGLWPLGFLLLLLLYNMTESAILRPMSLFWIMYVAVTVSAANPGRSLGSRDGARRAPRPLGQPLWRMQPDGRPDSQAA